MERDIGRDILGLRIQLIKTHIHFYFSSSLVSSKEKIEPASMVISSSIVKGAGVVAVAVMVAGERNK